MIVKLTSLFFASCLVFFAGMELVTPKRAQAVSFGALSIQSTPAILPSGKGALLVRGPSGLKWQIYNETGTDPARPVGTKITKGRGRYGLHFTPEWLGPEDMFITIYSGKLTTVIVP